MNSQIKLGLFVAIGLAAIMISIIAVGNFTLNRSYKVYVMFQNASGLTKKAKVKIAGVDVGVLNGVSLKDSKARLCLSINNDVTLYANAQARIVSMGIIGTKYIEVIPGDPSYPVIKDGDSINVTESASLEQSLNNIADKIDKALGSFGDGKNGNMMANLSDAVYDLKLVMRNVANQNEKIASAIDNVNKFSYNLAKITAENEADLRVAIANMRDISEKLDVIMAKIYDGEGTIGALVNDEQMSKDLKETVASAKEAVNSLKTTIGTGNRLQLAWDYMGRYNVRDEKFRSDVGLSISMRKERFYYVGISNVADTSDETDQKEKDTMNTLNALIGFRNEKAEIYGGVMKSKAGVGVGYSFFEPIYSPYRSVQLNLNAYNFSRDGKPPEIDAGVRLGLAKWLYAGVMVEDIGYAASVTPYIKLEIKDTDIAALLGIISVAAVASK